MGGKISRCLVIAFIIVSLPAVAIFAASSNPNDMIEELKVFSKAMGAIQEAYVGDVTLRGLLYQALKGMLSSLDKFSEFIEPERFKILQIHMKGEYAGIGAILNPVDGKIFIRGVEPGKPAEKAGVRVGDLILKIDGVSIEGKDVPEVSGLLRGEADSPVTITIMRGLPPQVLDIKIIRERIEIQSIQDAKALGKAVAYFRLADWQEHTAEQVEDTLKNFKSQGIKAIIIDLRNNGGGLLEQAVELSKKFLSKGKTIVSVHSKIEVQRKEYKTEDKGKYEDLKMVVLVNENSASASEVFSGAMQDNKRAQIIGVQTYGKGSVQSVIPLDDNSGMKLTTARYATPSGRIIDKVGLAPDVLIANGEGGLDRQLLYAVEIFKDYL